MLKSSPSRAPDSVSQAFLITKRWDAPQTFDEEPGKSSGPGGTNIGMGFYGQQWLIMVNNGE